MKKEEVITDQHFLPQCYLKGFTNESGKLYALNLEATKYGKQPSLKSYFPSQICYGHDFYTIGKGLETFNIKNIQDKYRVEKEFHAYEKDYQLLIDRICQGNQLAAHEASFLIRIIVDIKIRNKYFRENFIGSRQGEVIMAASNEIKDRLLNNLDYIKKYPGGTIDQMLNISDSVRAELLNDLDFKENAHLSVLIRKTDGYEDVMNKLIPKLLHCKWVIIESNKKFISNDNPGCSIDKNKRIHNSYFEKDFVFFMPLTSSLCLIISDESTDTDFYENPGSKKLLKVKATQDMINISNDFCFHHVNKLVLGSDKSLLEQLAKINRNKPSN